MNDILLLLKTWPYYFCCCCLMLLHVRGSCTPGGRQLIERRLCFEATEDIFDPPFSGFRVTLLLIVITRYFFGADGYAAI